MKIQMTVTVEIDRDAWIDPHPELGVAYCDTIRSTMLGTIGAVR